MKSHGDPFSGTISGPVLGPVREPPRAPKHCKPQDGTRRTDSGNGPETDPQTGPETGPFNNQSMEFHGFHWNPSSLILIHVDFPRARKQRKPQDKRNKSAKRGVKNARRVSTRSSLRSPGPGASLDANCPRWGTTSGPAVVPRRVPLRDPRWHHVGYHCGSRRGPAVGAAGVGPAGAAGAIRGAGPALTLTFSPERGSLRSRAPAIGSRRLPVF